MKAYLTLAILVYRNMYRNKYGCHNQEKLLKQKVRDKRSNLLWPLLCTAVITTKPLFTIQRYLEKSAAYSGTGQL